MRRFYGRSLRVVPLNIWHSVMDGHLLSMRLYRPARVGGQKITPVLGWFICRGGFPNSLDVKDLKGLSTTLGSPGPVVKLDGVTSSSTPNCPSLLVNQ